VAAAAIFISMKSELEAHLHELGPLPRDEYDILGVSMCVCMARPQVGTASDDATLYMMMEAVMGGELFAYLQARPAFVHVRTHAHIHM
jgi:hypothetical protein